MNLPFNVTTENIENWLYEQLNNQEKIPCHWNLTIDTKNHYVNNGGQRIAIFRYVGDMAVFFWLGDYGIYNQQVFEGRAERYYSYVKPNFRLTYLQSGSVGILLDDLVCTEANRIEVMSHVLSKLDLKDFCVTYVSSLGLLKIELRTTEHTLDSWKKIKQQLIALNLITLGVKDN